MYEFILGRMNVRRDEGAGGEGRVPGKRIVAELLRHVGLAEDIPGNAVDADFGLGNASSLRSSNPRSKAPFFTIDRHSSTRDNNANVGAPRSADSVNLPRGCTPIIIASGGFPRPLV